MLPQSCRGFFPTVQKDPQIQPPSSESSTFGNLIKTKDFPNVCSICSHRVKEKKFSFPAVQLQPTHTESLEPCKHPDFIGENLQIKSLENSSIGRETSAWVFNTYRQNYCLDMQLPLLYLVLCRWLWINHYCLWHLPLNIMTFSPFIKAKLNSPGRQTQIIWATYTSRKWQYELPPEILTRNSSLVLTQTTL